MAVNEKGTTLIEGLIAMAILGFAVTGVMGAFMAQVETNSTSELRSMAIAASQKVLEGIRLEDPATLPTFGSTLPAQTVTVGEQEFQAVTIYCLNSTYCTSTSRHVTVDLYVDGNKVYDVETVYTKLE